MLKFNSVSKKIHLTELSFEFSDGVLCLVSDKKSTDDAFFSMITEELLPDSGYIKNTFSDILLCSLGLPCEITVTDYLDFVCKCKKRSVLPQKTVELTKSLSSKYIKHLSRFEKLQLSAAAALIGSPDLLLMPYPAHGLEPSDVRKLGSLIDSLREFTNIIFSSNVPSLFGEHSDTLIVISEGKTIAVGNADEIFSLSENNGGLFAKIKGDIDAASGFLDEKYTLEPSEKSGIFTVRCTDSDEARKEIRFVVRKLGMALLELKADNDVLKTLFKSLNEAEEEAELTESENKAENNDFYSENSEYDTEADLKSSNSEISNENEKKAVNKPRITISFAHNDDEEDE